MSSRRSIAGIAGVLCLLAASLRAGEVRGRLVADRKPIAGVAVEAVPLETPLEAARREARKQEAPKPLAAAATRPDGTFALVVASAPTTPPFRLQLSGGGTVPVLQERVFDPSDAEDLGDVTVARGQALAGRVTDESGGPVVGATVTLWSAGGAGGFGPGDRATGEPVPVTATTGADGAFRFAAAAERGNRLRVEAPGFATAERTGLRSGALLRPVSLALGRAITGTVVLADRKTPVGAALVRLEGPIAGRWVEARPENAVAAAFPPRRPAPARSSCSPPPARSAAGWWTPTRARRSRESG